MWFCWRPKKSIALVESKDGIHWSKPLIVLGPNRDTEWEEDVNRPAVLKMADGYHLWYTGQARGHSWIGYATSPDGKTWKRQSPRPVKGRWDEDAVYKPFPLLDRGRWLLWYNGRRGGGEKIGLAVHDGEDPCF
jgi:hypothetical protein